MSAQKAARSRAAYLSCHQSFATTSTSSALKLSTTIAPASVRRRRQILQFCRPVARSTVKQYRSIKLLIASTGRTVTFGSSARHTNQAKADAESVRPEKMCLMNKITIALPSKEYPGDLDYLTREPKSWGVAWVDPLDPRPKLIVLRKKKERSQCTEQKWSTKKELLGVLSKLREDGAIAK
ncbi:hypothetical protein D0867_08212 [Hortaea werneckii]|uniref:Uncharacterized protein n=1 Tax=Hortaea werneckii TaxID=91943 RepID=A0A3M6Z7R0_HORWE|nr:hypothetical protein D0867_08212 [Hortaea werneckii]